MRNTVVRNTLVGLAALGAFAVTACASSGVDESGDGQNATSSTPPQYVFILAMENQNASYIYGNTTNAPYMNSLMNNTSGQNVNVAWATNWNDAFSAEQDSELHYIYYASGTVVFPDITFATDNGPASPNTSAGTSSKATNNTTASHNNWAYLLGQANKTWMGFEEGISTYSGGTGSGLCPVNGYGSAFVPRHTPFVFYQDVVGTNMFTSTGALTTNVNSATSYCAEHFQNFTYGSSGPTGAFATYLATPSKVANLTFITPNLCHCMHGSASGSTPNSYCFSQPGSTSNMILDADNWMKANLPSIITFINAHNGLLLITWDQDNEGPYTGKTGLGATTADAPMAFFAIGPGVKPGANSTFYNSGSLTLTIDSIFGLPAQTIVPPPTSGSKGPGPKGTVTHIGAMMNFAMPAYGTSSTSSSSSGGSSAH